MSFPWFARLDHLQHRMWIEEKEANALWKGKTSYNRYTHGAYMNFKISIVYMQAIFTYSRTHHGYQDQTIKKKSRIEIYFF